ncbi:hypothetical protein IMCC21906_01041 [Spongiibacter sp. IMCC21906]|uniref:hypothetical protein n=1 Tax=Spongiibacter sp. IMCC21906 TaxID=1620392 RepID=UPI00062DFBE6|nr:hypothetical protein [Spongiibacter sp. IMCC21906]AKH68720.1 hypothetical protein IMCC21906_01041 [Spongiibacter sp. IMCC21906]
MNAFKKSILAAGVAMVCSAPSHAQIPVVGGLLGGDLLGGGIPVVGGLLGGDLLGGGIPVVGGLLGGDLLGGGIPVVGGLLGGDLLGGGIPVVGGLLGGDLLGGGIPVVGGLLGGDLLGGGIPVVGGLLGGDLLGGGIPVVGGLLDGGLPGLDLLSGGGIPVVGDLLGGGSGLASIPAVGPALEFILAGDFLPRLLPDGAELMQLTNITSTVTQLVPGVLSNPDAVLSTVNELGINAAVGAAPIVAVLLENPAGVLEYISNGGTILMQGLNGSGGNSVIPGIPLLTQPLGI